MPDLAEARPPEEIAPGMWRLIFPIPTFLKAVNAYLVRDHDGYAFVDCGMDTEECWSALHTQLAALGLPVSAIKTIVATHGHPDHTGMADRIRSESGADVWLHGSELPFINYRRSDNSAELLRAWLLRFGVPVETADQLAAHVREGDKATPAVKPTHLLESGQVLKMGDYTFEAQWTPGHTPGHVCLYEPTQHMLLSGDHILQDVAPNVSMQPFSDENPMPGYLRSLDWLSELPIERTLPGHGQPFPSPRERAAALIGHQRDRQAHLRTLLTPKPQTAWQLAAQVWAHSKPNTWNDFQPRLRRNAMATLAAHLELLADSGEANRVDDGVLAYAAA
jgi:glyoxylase-like metal-dependent hydrolase (beta-lactamase superfamily II)